MYLPRTLYRYYYSTDTFSRESDREEQQYTSIENERFFIEGKFPWLKNPEKTTQSLYFLPIHRVARALSNADFNLSKTRQKILFYKSEMKIYEKQLLRELFWDHDLYFDLDASIRFDEIILLIDDKLIEQLPHIRESLSALNKDTLLKLNMDVREIEKDNVFGVMNQIFEGYGWAFGGCEIYINTAI